MQACERRFPRDLFTKKLRRLCERLDELPVREVTFKDFRQRTRTTTVEVTSLWVAGSYARGSIDCGDLDVVIELRPDRGNPGPGPINRTFFGALPYVSPYLGNPIDNTSGVPFPDAVLIWDAPGCAWPDRISSIAVDLQAGRASRDTDGLPFRMEQLDGNQGDFLELLQQRKSGILDWSFVPLTEDLLRPISDEEQIRTDERLRRYTLDWGKKSSRLLPAIKRVIRREELVGEWTHIFSNDRELKFGGTLVITGSRPHVPYDRLAERADLRQLLIAPHISARGPNGLWLITRGPAHPDAALIASRSAYINTEDGAPYTLHVSKNGSFHDSDFVAALELFSTREGATEYAVGWTDEHEQPVVMKLDVLEVAGRELFKLISAFDALDIDGEPVALSRNGQYHSEGADVVTLSQLFSLLPSR